MISKYKNFYSKKLYIFFVLLSLNIFFFSTIKVESKVFDINNIEISKPFKIDFDKTKVIDSGFQKAFTELISLIINTKDQKKINQTKLKEIKSMIESFSIKEEKFINENYYVNLGVSFNKKKVFNFLSKRNIFPSIPLRKKILFIPIIIDENKKDLLIFNNNKIFSEWNKANETFHLIEYIMPTEDLEDLKLVESKFDFIEQYDFKEIINKYNLDDSIIALIFKNQKEVRILSRISIMNNVILKNQSFANTNLNNLDQVEKIISDLKIIYEDYWKNYNQINTSIKLPLSLKVNNSDELKVLNFEKVLQENDLVYDMIISKLDQNFIYYQIIYNGTPNNFLKSMNEKNFIFNTENKTWILK